MRCGTPRTPCGGQSPRKDQRESRSGEVDVLVGLRPPLVPDYSERGSDGADEKEPSRERTTAAPQREQNEHERERHGDEGGQDDGRVGETEWLGRVINARQMRRPEDLAEVEAAQIADPQYPQG